MNRLMNRKFLCVSVLGVLGALTANAALASTFTIAPVRAELRAGHRTAVFTLRNAEDDPVVIQVRVVAWSQFNGEEHLDDTRDVLATPPVIQIAGNSEQIVRVALRHEPDPARELTYRIIFQEVPQAAPAGFNGLRVALSLSVPVFVAPVLDTPKSDLRWDVDPLPDGEVRVSAVNDGTAHLQVTDFELQLAGAQEPLHGMTSKYVLPGSRISWVLKADAAALKSGPIVIHGHSDQGDFTAKAATRGS